jgi:hypothetical protein
MKHLLSALAAIIVLTPYVAKAQDGFPSMPNLDYGLDRLPAFKTPFDYTQIPDWRSDRVPKLKRPLDTTQDLDAWFNRFPMAKTPFDTSNCDGQLSSSPWQPNLPGRTLSSEMARVERALQSATPDPLPPEILVPPEATSDQRSTRREALAKVADQGRIHTAAVLKLRGQLARLERVSAAANDIRLLEQAQVDRATSGKLPGRAEFMEALFPPPDCKNILTRSFLQIATQTFLQSTKDLRFGLQVTTISLLIASSGEIEPEATVSDNEECSARKSKGEALAGCPFFPLAIDYYVVTNTKCAFQGAEVGADGKVKRVCAMFKSNDVSAPSVSEIAKFHEAVRQIALRIPATRAQHETSAAKLATLDGPVAKELLDLLRGEGAELAKWRAQLDVLRQDISIQRLEEADRSKSRSAAMEAEKLHAAAATKSSTQAGTIESTLDKDHKALDSIEGDLTKNQMKEDNVTLKCGGTSYSECGDEAAKLEFDRVKYEVRQERLELRSQMQKLRSKVSKMRADLRQATKAADEEERKRAGAEAEASRQGGLLAAVQLVLKTSEERFEQEDPLNLHMMEDNARDAKDIGSLARLVGVADAASSVD